MPTGRSCPATSAKRSPATGRRGRRCGGPGRAAGCGWTCARPAARSAPAPAGTRPADLAAAVSHMLDFPGVVVTDFRPTYRDEPDVTMTKIRLMSSGGGNEELVEGFGGGGVGPETRGGGEPADGGRAG